LANSFFTVGSVCTDPTADAVCTDPPAPLQPLPELINDALSILYVFGLLLCLADAQKLSSGKEGSVATTSAF